MVLAFPKKANTNEKGFDRPIGWVWTVFVLGTVLTPVSADFDVKTAFLQIGFALLLMMYSFRLLKMRYRGGKLELLLLMFVMYAVLSSVWAPTPGSAFQHFLRFVPCWGAFLLLRQSPGEPTEKRVLSAIIIGFSLASIFGLLQMISVRWMLPGAAWEKAFSTFGSSESWVLPLIAVAPMMLCLNPADRLLTAPWFRFFIGCILLLNLLFSDVVSAGIGLAVAGLALLGLRFITDATDLKNRKLFINLGCVLILLGVSLTLWNAASFSDRWSVWKSASRMFWDSPIMGWGGGGYTYQGIEYTTAVLDSRLSLQPDFSKNIHNEILEWAVEYGLLGLSVWMAFMAYFLGRIKSLTSKNPMVVWLEVSSIIGVWMASFFSDAFRQPASLFIMMVAMAWWMNRVSPAEEKEVPRFIARSVTAVLIVLSACLLFFTARNIYLDQIVYSSDRFVERLPKENDQRISVLEGLWSRHRGRSMEAPILYELGNSYRRAGRLDDAQTVLQIILRNNPRSVKACVLLGEVLYQNSRGDDNLVYASIKAYSKALEVQPDSVDILLARAKLDCASKRLSDCSADLQHILRIQPDQPEAKEMIQKLMK